MKFIIKLIKNILFFKEIVSKKEIYFLPGELFFVIRVKIPKGTEEKELNSFAKIQIEEQSPFPIEQLYWGFLRDASSTGILIYASTEERLKSYLGKNFETAFHVFPTFVSICMQVWEEPAVVCLLQNQTLSALYFESKDPIPSKVISIRIEGDTFEERFEAAFEKKSTLINNLKTNHSRVEEGIVVGEGVRINENGFIEFMHSHFPEKNIHNKIELPNTFLDKYLKQWHADCRNINVKNNKQKNQLISKRLWVSLSLNAWVICLIMFLVVGRLFVGGINSLLSKQVIKQKPIVQRIEQNSILLDKINQFTNKRFDPFSELALINQVRPNELTFESVKSGADSVMEIRGSANGVGAVNQFVKKIQEIPYNEEVELKEIQTRKGQVIFILESEFNLPERKVSAESNAVTEGSNSSNNIEEEVSV